MSFYSQIDDTKKLTSTDWCISQINTGRKWGGHIVIVVEGIKDDQLFTRVYDIKASVSAIANNSLQNMIGNAQGYITAIDENELNDAEARYLRDKASKTIWCVGAAHADRMMASIAIDKRRVDPITLEFKPVYKEVKRLGEQLAKMKDNDADRQQKVAQLVERITVLNEIAARSPFQYQAAGSKRMSSLGGNGADNCVTWSERHLREAGIRPTRALTDSIKALPDPHGKQTSCIIL